MSRGIKFVQVSEVPHMEMPEDDDTLKYEKYGVLTNLLRAILKVFLDPARQEYSATQERAVRHREVMLAIQSNDILCEMLQDMCDFEFETDTDGHEGGNLPVPEEYEMEVQPNDEEIISPGVYEVVGHEPDHIPLELNANEQAEDAADVDQANGAAGEQATDPVTAELKKKLRAEVWAAINTAIDHSMLANMDVQSNSSDEEIVIENLIVDDDEPNTDDTANTSNMEGADEYEQTPHDMNAKDDDDDCIIPPFDDVWP